MLAWPSLDALGVDAFVTTRHGGVSAGPYATLNLGLHVGDTEADVLVNRRRVAAALGADLGDFVFCNQVHGRRVAVVSAADRGRGALRLGDAVAVTDALVTTDPGTVLAILVADCVPIILVDPQAGVLACVHAGWRGTVAGVTGAALHAMQGLGARPGADPRGDRPGRRGGPLPGGPRGDGGGGPLLRREHWPGSCTPTVPGDGCSTCPRPTGA